MIALIIAILPNVPGFLHQVNVITVSSFWSGLYNYAWFIGFLVAFFVYGVLSYRSRVETTVSR